MEKNLRSTGEASLALYLREMRKIPLLGPEEEQVLARASRAGDTSARQYLVQANLRFVVSVARQHAHRGLPLEDLINEGNIGLMKAAERFDPDRGIRFISYAVWWIRSAIRRALPDWTDAATLSLESTVSGQEDASPLGASLEDNSVSRPEETLVDNSLREGVDAALLSLPHRDQRILRDRFGLTDRAPVTLGEVGRRYGLTRERIRQIEKRAMSRLRAAGSAKALEVYVN